MIFTGRSGRSGQWIWNGERKAEPRKSLAAYQEGKLAEEVANLLREDFQPFKKDWIYSCEEFCLAMPIHRFRSTWIVHKCSMYFHVPCVCSSVPKVTTGEQRRVAILRSSFCPRRGQWFADRDRGSNISQHDARDGEGNMGDMLWYLWYVATILQRCNMQCVIMCKVCI